MPSRCTGLSSSGLREPLSSEGPAQPPSLWLTPAFGGPLPGMLLVPKAQGLVEMLQTIYETESCFSADGMSGREPSLEILPRTPLHGIPVSGKCLGIPACPLPLGILVPGSEPYPHRVPLRSFWRALLRRWSGEVCSLRWASLPSLVQNMSFCHPSSCTLLYLFESFWPPAGSASAAGVLASWAPWSEGTKWVSDLPPGCPLPRSGQGKKP